MQPIIVFAALLALSCCQIIECRDHATCSTISQERGGNSPSTLNPAVSDPNVQVNAAGDQSRGDTQ